MGGEGMMMRTGLSRAPEPREGARPPWRGVGHAGWRVRAGGLRVRGLRMGGWNVPRVATRGVATAAVGGDVSADMGGGDLSHYEVLGLTPSATTDEVKKQYRRLAKQLHPDVSKAPDASARFVQATAAYECLADPIARWEYDAVRLAAASGGLSSSASSSAAVRGQAAWRGLARDGGDALRGTTPAQRAAMHAAQMQRMQRQRARRNTAGASWASRVRHGIRDDEAPGSADGGGESPPPSVEEWVHDVQ